MTAEHQSHSRDLGAWLVLGGFCSASMLLAALRPAWQVDWIGSAPPEPVVVTPQPSAPQPSATATARPAEPEIWSAADADLAWLRWLLIGLALLTVLVAVITLAVRIRPAKRPRPATQRPGQAHVEVVAGQPVSPEPSDSALALAAQRATARLAEAGEPTDAVVAAWLALQDAAQASGAVRHPAQTPTEFTTEVLARTGAPAKPVQDLLDLYLRARFGAAPATAADVRNAQACVGALAEHWASLHAADAGTP